MTLRDAILALDDYQRAQIESISICAVNGGYTATMEQWGLFPAGIDPSLQAQSDEIHVAVSHLAKRPAFTADITWHIPVWDQVIEVINDPYLTQPSVLGTMQASEGTYADPNQAREADHRWYIVTHGLPRSKERVDWIKSRNVL